MDGSLDWVDERAGGCKQKEKVVSKEIIGGSDGAIGGSSEE